MHTRTPELGPTTILFVNIKLARFALKNKFHYMWNRTAFWSHNKIVEISSWVYQVSYVLQNSLRVEGK